MVRLHHGQDGPRDAHRGLPHKPCVVCGRPFAWRKKWERCWEQVRYCSDRCRMQRRTSS
ncbi:MAG: DUF2256 domain-containing protein [Planctomycetaceae bacterium]